MKRGPAVVLDRRTRAALREAAQLVANGAELFHSDHTVTDNYRGKPSRVRWDSRANERTYYRENTIAARLRDLARGIVWKR